MCRISRSYGAVLVPVLVVPVEPRASRVQHQQIGQIRWGHMMIKLQLLLPVVLLSLSTAFQPASVSIVSVEAFLHHSATLLVKPTSHVKYYMRQLLDRRCELPVEKPLYCTQQRYDLYRRRYQLGMGTTIGSSGDSYVTDTNITGTTGGISGSSVRGNPDIVKQLNDYVDDDVTAGNNHFFDRAIINHKLQGLHLSDQKLLVLQDAAKRMVQRHETEMKAVQQHHSSNLATTIHERNSHHANELEDLHRTMERRLRQMEVDRKNAFNELKRTKYEYDKRLDVERKSSTATINEITSTYKKDRTTWIDVERRLRDELDMVVEHSKSMARDSNITNHNLAIELRQQNEKYQLLQSKYETRTQRYRRAVGEMEALRTEISELITERATLQANEVMVQKQCKDQMEIAEAAVAAATQRETILQEQYDALQQTNDQLQDQVSRRWNEQSQRQRQRQQLEDSNNNDNNNELQQKQIVAVEKTATKTATAAVVFDTGVVSPNIRQQQQRRWIGPSIGYSLTKFPLAILTKSFRWIQYVFMPRLGPIPAALRRTTTKPQTTTNNE